MAPHRDAAHVILSLYIGDLVSEAVGFHCLFFFFFLVPSSKNQRFIVPFSLLLPVRT